MVIISASRRTDMPAFFPEKIMHEVRNHLMLDGLVLWTKNPEPFMPYIKELQEKEIPFYFQYTLNDYRELEPGIPSLSHRLDTFRELSKMVGKERVIWRYDPLLVTDKLDICEVIERFKSIAYYIHNHTEKCVFSIVDMYPKLEGTGIRAPNMKEVEYAERNIWNTCKQYHITPMSCAEEFRLFVIEPSKCIDVELLNRISGNTLPYKKDASQRERCGCAKSTDIGEYHTCKHNCVYCYAK